MSNNHGVMRSSKMDDCLCFSFINSNADMDNGMIFAKGMLVNGEREIYHAEAPTADNPIFIVDTPAWSYRNYSATDQNEENFYIPKGETFRGRELKPNRVFQVSANMLNGTPSVNQYVVVDDGSHKLKVSTAADDSAFVGRIIAKTTIGFNYCIGSAGDILSTGANGSGGVISNTHDFYSIEIVKNG